MEVIESRAMHCLRSSWPTKPVAPVIITFILLVLGLIDKLDRTVSNYLSSLSAQGRNSMSLILLK